MLSVQTIQLLVTGGVVGGVIGFLVSIPYLKKKGVNVDGAIDTIDNVINQVEPIINVAKEIAPNNKVINIVDMIEKWAKIGVKNAEQLYNSNQLPSNEDRKTEAGKTVYSVLKEFGIEPTENQQKLINDTIEASVADLPHAPIDIKQLQTTINQQNDQNTQLQQTNEQLKNTIAQIQSTVQTNTANVINLTQAVQSTPQ